MLEWFLKTEPSFDIGIFITLIASIIGFCIKDKKDKEESKKQKERYEEESEERFKAIEKQIILQKEVEKEMYFRQKQIKDLEELLIKIDELRIYINHNLFIMEEINLEYNKITLFSNFLVSKIDYIYYSHDSDFFYFNENDKKLLEEIDVQKLFKIIVDLREIYIKIKKQIQDNINNFKILNEELKECIKNLEDALKLLHRMACLFREYDINEMTKFKSNIVENLKNKYRLEEYNKKCNKLVSILMLNNVFKRKKLIELQNINNLN